MTSLHLTGQLDAAHFRHPDVGDNEVGCMTLEGGKGCESTRCPFYLISALH